MNTTNQSDKLAKKYPTGRHGEGIGPSLYGKTIHNYNFPDSSMLSPSTQGYDLLME